MRFDKYEASFSGRSYPTTDYIRTNCMVAENAVEKLFKIMMPISYNIESSEFSWEEEAENISKKLLKQNAVTLLMGYARPLIAHLTVDAGYKPLTLPFVDLREDIKNMEE